VDGIGFGSGYLLRRLVQIGLGLALLAVVSLADYRWIRRLALPAALLSGALLIFVLETPAVRGTHGWLNIFGFSLQPVDVARVCLLLYMAHALARSLGETSLRRRFARPVIALVAALLLVARQPDYGSALALALSGAVVLMVAGLPRRWILVGLVFGLGLSALAYAKIDRVRERVDITYRADPAADSAERYQLKQSLIALGAGGWIGQGAGTGRQKQFLPDHHTDFILAIVGEEFGLAGTLILLALLTALCLRVLRIAQRQADPFARYLAAGIGGMLFVYTALNMAVAVGLFPLTGVPLPFVSHGGSALVMNLVALGLVLSVSREPHRGEALRVEPAPPRSPRAARLRSAAPLAEPLVEDLFRGRRS
jgi:cell division protein FtsW (lipid II flippase)